MFRFPPIALQGANIGTTITCLLVSLAHASDSDELERAFGASAMYFLFNLLTLGILLPLEITTGFLKEFTGLMLPSTVSDGDSWEGPVKKMVGPLVKTLIIANKDLIDDIATGEVESCDAVYPVSCVDDHASYDTCDHHGSLIMCNSKNGRCPAFFQVNGSKQDDMVSAWVCFIIALFLLILCLIL
jgi:sodium-dependent phosphate cotransporter